MEHQERQIVRVDGYTRFCLTAITVLLTVLVIGLWTDAIQTARPAGAQTPFKDEKARQAFEEGRWGTSSAQGKMAAVQGETNTKLDELIRLFKSGEAKVQVAESPTSASGAAYEVKKKPN